MKSPQDSILRKYFSCQNPSIQLLHGILLNTSSLTGFKFTQLTCRTVFFLIIGTLRSEDGDGRENVAEEVNSRSFNLHRDYS